MSESRQLAAIVFTDIAGYSQAMGTDEKYALELLKKHRSIIPKIVASFHGEFLKEMGDGTLSRFSSVIDAVRCSIKIQKEAQASDLPLRIGIHIGDVVTEQGDVFGSGVNIASRIEHLSNAGGICISGDVWRQISNQTDLSAESLGTRELKGVKEPVEIFKLLTGTSTDTVKVDTSSEYLKLTLIADLIDRKFPHIVVGYGLLCWAIVSLVSYIVNISMLSPHLINLTFFGMISLLPTIFMLAYFHGKKGLRDFSRIEKIGIPINILASALILFIAFYPKDLGAIIETVSIEDELGNRINKVVPKSEFRKKIAIFYFENETGDATLDWLRYGLPWLCDSDLEQDFYISHTTQDYFDYKIENAGYTRHDKLPLSLKKKISTTLNKNYFLQGSFNITDDTYRVKTELYNSKNGNIISENKFVESNIFILADKLVKQLKIDLQIPLQYLNATTDLPVQSITTDNVEAFKSYINGKEKLENDQVEAAFEHYNNSVTYDKYFLQAQVSLSDLKMGRLQDASWKEHWDIILKSIDKLTDRTKFNFKMAYYRLTGDEELYKILALRQVKLYPHDIKAHDNLASVYYHENNPDRFENSIKEYKIILQIDPERYEYYQEIGNVYQQMTQFDSALHYHEKYCEAVPDDYVGYYMLSINYQAQGRISDAVSALQNAIILGNEDIWMKTELLWMKKYLNKDTSSDVMINELNNMLAISENFKDSLAIYLNLKWVYYEKAQLKAAVEYMNIRTNLKEIKWGLYHAIFQLVEYDIELFIQAGFKDTIKKHLTYLENNAVSPDDNIIPYFYSKYYLYTEKFDMLAATIDEAEDGYGNY